MDVDNLFPAADDVQDELELPPGLGVVHDLHIAAIQSGQFGFYLTNHKNDPPGSKQTHQYVLNLYKRKKLKWKRRLVTSIIR